MLDSTATASQPAIRDAQDARGSDAAAASHLKVLFVTEDEPLFMGHTFRKIMETRPDWLEVAAVALLDFAPVGTRGDLVERIAKLTAVYGLGTTLRTAARLFRHWLTPSQRLVPILAEKRVELVRIHDVNGPEAAALIDRADPDVTVTVGLNRIISAATLERGRTAWMNIHLGLLPRHRGPAPVFWALHNGDREVGVSIHMIVERVDAGPVLSQKSRAVAERSLYSEVHELRMLSVDALYEALDRFRRNDIPPPPDLPLPKAHSTPRRADVRTFRNAGNRLL